MFNSKIFDPDAWQESLVDSLRLNADPVDVLIVTDQQYLPDCLVEQIEEIGLSWQKAPVDDFLTQPFEADQIGTIVLDTSEVLDSCRDMLCKIVRRMEYGNTATILVNNTINFPINNFDLVTILESASVDEIVGRIETNVKYHKKGISVIEPASDDESVCTLCSPHAELSSDMSEQMKIASQVQRDFLPKILPNSEKFLWSTFYQPADWVSGDIYDVQRLDEKHIGFYIADAMGHSVPAALLTIFIKQAMVMRQTYGNTYEIFQPAEVIAKLNEKMFSQGLSGCSFATVCYCLLNIEKNTLTYARGGHPYPVLVRNGEPMQLECKGGLVGVFDSNTFEQETIQLEHSDKIFLYSDGAEAVVGGCHDSARFEFCDDFMRISKLTIDDMVTQFGRLAAEGDIDQAHIDDITAVGLEIL